MEVTIALQVNVPNKEVAKQVANEAQALLDAYGADTFLRGVSFIKNHPDMLNIAIGMIQNGN